MNLTTRIAVRHLWSRHNFGFISFSTILSIFGLTIGIASLIIISSISSGFTDMINIKLSAIDGHMRIRSYMSDKISLMKIMEIDSSIHQISDNIRASAPYIEKHAIARYGLLTEGIILYGVPEYSLETIFNLEEFTTGYCRFNNQESIIIGRKFAQSLDLKIGDNVMIIDIEKMAREQILIATNFTIVNIFQTDFPEYDRLLAFIPIQAADKFFKMDSFVSGLIVNVDNPEDIDMTAMQLSDEMGLNPFMTTTWKDRHMGLLEWLTLYDIPIKIIMIFITAVGIFNIAASLWMIIIEKTRELGIMKSMGLNAASIKKIIIKEGAFIGFAGALGGITLSIIVLYLQKTFHFITLPNDIYFMNYLPVKLVPIYFILYPLCAFIITIVFSYYPAHRASVLSPAKALRYE